MTGQQWHPLPTTPGMPPHEYSQDADGVVTFRRIERPVPTTDERWDKIDALTREWRQAIITDDEYSEAVRALLPTPHPPTREQIAEAAMDRYPALNPDAEELTYPRSAIRDMTRGAFEAGAQYVLARIQNGADR